MKTSQAFSRPERWLRLASWALAIVFALFLNMLGSLVIRDLMFAPRGGPPEAAQFADTARDATLRDERRALEGERASLSTRQDAANAGATRARRDYDNAREAFRNWVATRTATGDSSRNPELLARTQELDKLQAALAGWQKQQDTLADQASALEQRSSALETRAEQAGGEADQRYQAALRRYSLAVFGWRLAFTLPVLLLAVWLFLRYRRARYWPFVHGFGLFALSAFFVELVPYLPDFGGYVRVAVGIALTIFAGIYMLRAFQRYVERKREEMQRSQDERAQSIGYEKAIASFQKKMCPSCDKPWSLGGEQSTFCIHCGLKLFQSCACGTRNFAFFPFCSGCGAAVQREEPPAAS
ncbi:zinc ribbon domain-containing protein [Burkholderia gladioli]|uniref:zinc ribbon domain-containing protein n=1 Tax=Burkholderia gladioli TaxID=28095 RepID=UPI00164153A0|nr:zinc ribbon domain-containing protein [Burkholderia gladioli]